MRPMLSLAVVFFVVPSLARAEDFGDEDRVREVVLLHVEGVRNADRALLEKAWDLEHGRVFWIEESAVAPVAEVVKSKPATELFTLWTESPEPEARAEILAVDVRGRIATVALEFEWRGARLAESIALVQESGEWKIVSKLFVTLSERAAGGAYGG